MTRTSGEEPMTRAPNEESMTRTAAEENLTEETSQKQETGREDRVDALISIVIGVGAILFLAGSQQYVGVRSGANDPGAAFWPQIILSVVILSCSINLITIYRRGDAEFASAIRSVSLDDAGRSIRWTNLTAETRKYVLCILLTVGYLAVLTDVGFLVSTTIFLALFIRTLGYDSIGTLSAVSIVASLLIFVLFRNFMNIALPYGTGVFRQLGIVVEGLI